MNVIELYEVVELEVIEITVVEADDGLRSQA